MTPRLRLGRGNGGELDDALAEADAVGLLHKEKVARLTELAKQPEVLAKLGLKVGDVLVETVLAYRQPAKITRWSVVGTELETGGRAIAVVAVNILANGKMGNRKLSRYAEIELEKTDAA